jgi:hypothetical protein
VGRGGDNAGLSSTTTTVITDEKKWIVKEEPELGQFETKDVEGSAFQSSQAWSPAAQSLRSANPEQDDEDAHTADFSNPLYPGKTYGQKAEADPLQESRPIIRKDSIGSMYDFNLESEPTPTIATPPDMSMAYGGGAFQKQEPPMAPQGLLDIDDTDINMAYSDDGDDDLGPSPSNLPDDNVISRSGLGGDSGMMHESSYDQEFMSYLNST